MIKNKRFVLEKEDSTICVSDYVRKKYIFTFACEDIDIQKSMLEECGNVVNCLNQIWEQTQRFEKYNQEYITENEELKKENEYLQQKIEDLNYENIEIIHDKMFLEEKLEDIEKENGEND